MVPRRNPIIGRLVAQNCPQGLEFSWTSTLFDSLLGLTGTLRKDFLQRFRFERVIRHRISFFLHGIAIRNQGAPICFVDTLRQHAELASTLPCVSGVLDEKNQHPSLWGPSCCCKPTFLEPDATGYPAMPPGATSGNRGEPRLSGDRSRFDHQYQTSTFPRPFKSVFYTSKYRSCFLCVGAEGDHLADPAGEITHFSRFALFQLMMRGEWLG